MYDYDIFSSLGWVRGNTKAYIGQKSISFDGHTHNYASVSHSHSASQITSGTLSVARGGTGVSDIESLKSVLGVSDITGIKKYSKSITMEIYSTSTQYLDKNDEFYIAKTSIISHGAYIVDQINGWFAINVTGVNKITSAELYLTNSTDAYKLDVPSFDVTSASKNIDVSLSFCAAAEFPIKQSVNKQLNLYLIGDYGLGTNAEMTACSITLDYTYYTIS